jgi:pyruvate,water dikinase
VKTLWLGQQDCHDRHLVGGKAAMLSRLAAEHCVPPGFCLPASAFDPTAARSHAVEETTGRPPQLPLGLLAETEAAYLALSERCAVECPAVAVRSSAVDEDGRAASFAGQHETYLNVVGPQAVAEAVARCWASALAPRAQTYRRRHGGDAGEVRLAVLVQQLVAADVSAVAFSAHPLTGDPAGVVINASWGLGESLVGGTVTPDTYVVRKTDLALISCQIARKERMTVASGQGTREVEVPRFLRAQPALSDDQVAEVARLAVSLEETLGRPVDVECAYHGGELYLLQCQPITALMLGGPRAAPCPGPAPPAAGGMGQGHSDTRRRRWASPVPRRRAPTF